MRNFNENTITAAVVERMAAAPDPRVRQISQALVRHLHDFVREVELTEAEWRYAIDFLTRAGKMCDGNRQEFILLSDTLGVTMLVDAINHRIASGATATTLQGPFYVENLKEHPLGSDVAGGAKGEPLYFSGTVKSIDGKPIAGAIVDVWHSDAEGFYDVQHLHDVGGHCGRARFRTDKDGRVHFWTVKPAAYPVPYDGPGGEMIQAQGRHPWRPAHVHFMIAAPGYVKLTTHVFVAGDQYLDSDVVFGVKDSLIRTFDLQQAGTAPDGRAMNRKYWTLAYDFALQAEK
jgi:hydroxyquinol 1,2-dioxygenase